MSILMYSYIFCAYMCSTHCRYTHVQHIFSALKQFNTHGCQADPYWGNKLARCVARWLQQSVFYCWQFSVVYVDVPIFRCWYAMLMSLSDIYWTAFYPKYETQRPRGWTWNVEKWYRYILTKLWHCWKYGRISKPMFIKLHERRQVQWIFLRFPTFAAHGSILESCHQTFGSPRESPWDYSGSREARD